MKRVLKKSLTSVSTNGRNKTNLIKIKIHYFWSTTHLREQAEGTCVPIQGNKRMHISKAEVI